MADLVSGRYHQTNPVYTSFLTSNVGQGDIPGRSNLSFHGAGALTESVLTTKEQAIAAVPVEWGDIITKINVPITATAGEAASETFVALYTGVAKGKASKLLAQGKAVKAAVTAEALFTQELESSVMITEANAPNRFVYAAICTKATTIASVACWKIKAPAVSYVTGAPVWGGKEAQKAATEAAAEWTVAGFELVPWFILS